MNLYPVDFLGVWTGEVVSHVPKTALVGKPLAPPILAGGEFARWTGSGWVVLAEYPAAPPPPVPASISRFQARAALMQAGLLEGVEAAVFASDPLIRLAWAEAIEWRRDSPTIAAVADALGLTREQMDDLFRVAAAITA